MAIDPKYVISPNLQEVFFDVRTGELMSNGTVTFYSDINRANKKSVYTLQGNEANYTFTPLPNPITLNAMGMPVDNAGNIIRIYYYPWMSTNPSIPELYYIKVFNGTGAEQFTRQAWPGNEQSGGGSGSGLSEINLIPNGQLLAHTNIPNNTLVGGVNVLAQGGFEFVLDPSPTSTNKYEFVYTQPSNIPQDPRFVGVFTTSNSNPSENLKILRVKFKDVNKFLNTEGTIYQFAFWALSDVQITANINVRQNFGTGGSEDEVTPITSIEILTSGNQLYNASIDFSSLPTGTIGTLSDDFIAIEIALPRNISYSFQHSDFVLLASSNPLSSFPIQTNSDMLTRGIMGWVNTPNPDGSDLFCPPVLTRAGMIFDHSSIGKIEASSGVVLSPNDLLATVNDMPCDGATYISSNFSTLTIPYSRLGNYLINASPILNYPVYGTGPDYATALPDLAVNTAFYLTVNATGTPIARATDGLTLPVDLSTGWDFSQVITYNGSLIGATGFYPIIAWSGTNFLQAISSTFLTTSFADGAGASATGFTFNIFTNPSNTGLYASQNISGVSISTLSAAILHVAALANCKYFTLVTGAGTVNIVYRIAGDGVVPAVAAPFVIDLPISATDAQVAQITAYALKELQSAYIVVNSASTSLLQGKYWTFQTNPGALRNFYVWYSINNAGVDPITLQPAIAGYTGIKVNLDGTETNQQTLLKTQLAINSYQYAAPDLRGVFLRGVDPNSNYDLDKFYRINQGLGAGGLIGSLEYQQYLSHNHTANRGLNNGLDKLAGTDAQNAGTFLGTAINNSGGAETRPVNSYVNWVIKY